MAKIMDSLKHALGAFNAFRNEDEQQQMGSWTYGGSFGGFRPDRNRMSVGNDRSIISSIYTRLSIDVASHEIKHVKNDEEGRYSEDVNSGLNYCLTQEANIDQAARHFRQDIAMTLFDKGVIAIVPVDTTSNPNITDSFDIKTMRVGEITQWYPRHVKVRLYNDQKGQFQEVLVLKQNTCIIENPLYAVMNEQNSNLQRLIRKLGLLDSVDEQMSSAKLDMIIQLPYVIKTQAKADQAAERAKNIEMQLKGSQYGIAYTDGTEKITQLNRPVENKLLPTVEFLTKQLFGQLGLTPGVFDGTASEAEMNNYYNRTIEPVLAAITEAMSRAFLTKTARTQGHRIRSFRDPFKLLPVSSFAEVADKFTRNEILSSNDLRHYIGIKPSKDPKADQLVNSNVPQPAVPGAAAPPPEEDVEEDDDGLDDVNAAFDDAEAELDAIVRGLG